MIILSSVGTLKVHELKYSRYKSLNRTEKTAYLSNEYKIQYLDKVSILYYKYDNYYNNP